MKTLKYLELVKLHHKKLLDFRNQERVISSESFQKAWEKATDIEKKEAFTLIKRAKFNQLRIWCLEIVSGKLESLNSLRLRHLARLNHIPNYSRKTKEELIKILKEKNGRRS